MLQSRQVCSINQNNYDKAIGPLEEYVKNFAEGEFINPVRLALGRCYINKGDLATIGRFRAVALIVGMHLSGWFAWWTWLFIHILYLAGFRNRASVLFEWGWSFFTYQRGARLIIGDRRGPGASI